MVCFERSKGGLYSEAIGLTSHIAPVYQSSPATPQSRRDARAVGAWAATALSRHLARTRPVLQPPQPCAFVSYVCILHTSHRRISTMSYFERLAAQDTKQLIRIAAVSCHSYVFGPNPRPGAVVHAH